MAGLQIRRIPANFEAALPIPPIEQGQQSRVGEVALPIRDGGNSYQTCVEALVCASSLIIGEKEDLVLLDGATESAAELILWKGVPMRGEIIPRIEHGISQELEDVP